MSLGPIRLISARIPFCYGVSFNIISQQILIANCVVGGPRVDDEVRGPVREWGRINKGDHKVVFYLIGQRNDDFLPLFVIFILLVFVFLIGPIPKGQ